MAANVFASIQTQTTQNKPSRIYLAGATASSSDDNHSIENDYGYPQNNLIYSSEEEIASAKAITWIDGFGGGGSGASSDNGNGEYFIFSYAQNDQSVESDSITLDSLGTGNEYQNTYSMDSYTEGGNTYSYTTTNLYSLHETISSYVVNEHCSVIDSAHPPFWTYLEWTSNLGPVLRQITTKETYQRNAQAVWHVQTGGMGIPGRQNLWQFSGGAQEILDKRGPNTDKREITNKTQIALGDLGTLKSDGTLWITLPDGADKDITPTVAGMDFYTFNVSGQKYPLTIIANGNDLSVTNPEFCVGQQIKFTFSGLPGVLNMVGKWNLPGKYVNEQWQNQQWVVTDPISGSGYLQPYGSLNYRVNDSLLEDASQTSCWFVNGNGGQVSVNLNLQFSNGQFVSVAANGNVNVFRPSVSIFTETNTVPSFYTNYGNFLNLINVPLVSLGGDNDPRAGDGYEHEMNYYVLYDTGDWPGTGGVTQLIQASYSGPAALEGYSFSDWRLDGDDELYAFRSVDPEDIDYAPELRGVFFSDAPHNGHAYILGTVMCIASFQDYCRFKPDGANSIYVTIGIINWSCDGESASANSTSVNSVTGPIRPDSSDAFPQWQNVLSGGSR